MEENSIGMFSDIEFNPQIFFKKPARYAINSSFVHSVNSLQWLLVQQRRQVKLDGFSSSRNGATQKSEEMD